MSAAWAVTAIAAAAGNLVFAAVYALTERCELSLLAERLEGLR